jgi:hypothetical protein
MSEPLPTAKPPTPEPLPYDAEAAAHELLRLLHPGLVTWPGATPRSAAKLVPVPVAINLAAQAVGDLFGEAGDCAAGFLEWREPQPSSVLTLYADETIAPALLRIVETLRNLKHGLELLNEFYDSFDGHGELIAHFAKTAALNAGRLPQPLPDDEA